MNLVKVDVEGISTPNLAGVIELSTNCLHFLYSYPQSCRTSSAPSCSPAMRRECFA